MANRSRGRGQISELTHIAPIKQGFINPPAVGTQPIRYADRLRSVLEAFHSKEDQGAPGVIRLFRAIHSAQWAMLDGDTRLMLNVVFDGELHGYLRALARDVPGMLNLIWSNCEGWEQPEADGKQLIEFIERHQVRVNFFYAQHPQLTVPDVERLLRLRDAVDNLEAASPCCQQLQAQIYRANAPLSNANRLASNLTAHGDTDRAKKAFLSLFEALYEGPEIERAYREAFGGSLPAPQASSAAPGRAHGIQGIVLAEYPAVHSARMLFVHFTAPDAARAWVSTIRQRVTFGSPGNSGPYLNVGFTYDGLAALGVDRAVLSDFPEAFSQGMDARSARLGDSPPAAPAASRQHWTEVLDETNPVHAVLFVYAQLSEGVLQQELLAAGKAAQASALDDSYQSAGRTPSDVSSDSDRLSGALSAVLDAAQANLDLGTRASAPIPGVGYLGHQDLHRPLVKHSEDRTDAYGVEYFGFRDGLGQPRLPDLESQAEHTVVESDCSTEHASFDPVLRTDAHGLLKNATFLVARQLRQDPSLFWQSMQQQALALGVTKRELAEQVVGRRMDGRRLDSTASHYDPVRDREAFDPDHAVASCPFHSHVRRSNPRTESSLASNPRLLRRSLAFLNARPKRYDRGLMFMAFNADLETQFELIQRHWLQAGNHVGLSSSDRDVLAGSQPARKPYVEPTPARFYADFANGADEGRTASRELRFEHTFITLEWGIYVYFPAREALLQL